VAGWNFTKLEVKVVKLSLQDKFVLEFAAKLPRFRTNAADRWAAAEKMC